MKGRVDLGLKLDKCYVNQHWDWLWNNTEAIIGEAILPKMFTKKRQPFQRGH